jgi:hypothetical protein
MANSNTSDGASATAPPYLRQNEARQKALAFLSEAKPKEGVEYGWVGDYAKDLWAHRLAVKAVLDEKAEAIIRYLGGGTGLFALGVLAKVDSSNVYLAACSIPAVVCALAAIGVAIWSRKPTAYPNLPTVQVAKEEYADVFKVPSPAVGEFLGQWNLACESARLVSLDKARWVERAYYLAYASMLFLLLPLFVAVIRPPGADVSFRQLEERVDKLENRVDKLEKGKP